MRKTVQKWVVFVCIKFVVENRSWIYRVRETKNKIGKGEDDNTEKENNIPFLSNVLSIYALFVSIQLLYLIKRSLSLLIFEKRREKKRERASEKQVTFQKGNYHMLSDLWGRKTPGLPFFTKKEKQ